MMFRSSLAAILLSSVLVAPVLADDFPPMISVTGEAQISAPPDLAIIDGGVTSDARTAREASEANNTAMGKVLLALKGAGIAEKDVQTQRLSLQPQYAANPKGPAVVTGYRASNRVAIKLRDMTLVAQTLDTLIGAGANEVGGINFTIAQPSKLLDTARTEAIADARRKAEIYAKAAGVTLGVPVNITEGGNGGPMPLLRGKMAQSFDLRAVAPAAVEMGEETLRMSVAVSWTIKPTTVPEPAPQNSNPVPPNPIPVPPSPLSPAVPPIPPAPVPQ